MICLFEGLLPNPDLPLKVNRDLHVALTPKPSIRDGVLKTVTSLVVRPPSVEDTRFIKLSVSVSFKYSVTDTGLGCECNVNVCVLGSDLMWLQHRVILMSNSCPSHCPICDQPLLPCWKVWTCRFWQVFGRGGWGLVPRREFFACYG